MEKRAETCREILLVPLLNAVPTMAVKSIRKLLQDVPRFLAIAKRVDALNSTTFKRVSELSDDPVLLKASSHLSRARILRSPSHTQTKNQL